MLFRLVILSPCFKSAFRTKSTHTPPWAKWRAHLLCVEVSPRTSQASNYNSIRIKSYRIRAYSYLNLLELTFAAEQSYMLLLLLMA